MKTIQVLGAGCAKCRTLMANAEQAIRDSDVEARVIKVQDISEMLEFDGVRGLPALAVDGVVKVCGRVPGVDELKGLLTSNALHGAKARKPAEGGRIPSRLPEIKK